MPNMFTFITPSPEVQLSTSNYQASLASWTRSVQSATSDALAIPFDLAREQYALSVQAGLIERSLLASARFSRALIAAEKLTLGPWARQV